LASQSGYGKTATCSHSAWYSTCKLMSRSEFRWPLLEVTPVTATKQPRTPRP
jgi:hypothetical protein